jgi:hypothetical protein
MMDTLDGDYQAIQAHNGVHVHQGHPSVQLIKTVPPHTVRGL